MYISKSRFINWTRCPMYFAMDCKDDTDAELERRKEMMEELAAGVSSSSGMEESEDDDQFNAAPSPELVALLPYYNQVEDEALKVAKKYFHGTFVANPRDVPHQKLFEYVHNDNTYRCYVDIYNENKEEINIIEVKATTTSKYLFRKNEKGEKKGLWFSERRGSSPYPVFRKEGNIWHFNTEDGLKNAQIREKFEEKKKVLLDRYSNEGKYPYDLAFQRFVIEHALREAGDTRRINFYLAVLNNEYIYDGVVDESGARTYNETDGQEIVTFFDLNETTEAYQPFILKEIAKLESYIKEPHNINKKVNVGKWCAWGKNTECVFLSHCFQKLRSVPDTNSANKYLYFHKIGFLVNGDRITDKYQLINDGYYKFDDVPYDWLHNNNHLIQRDCHDNDKEYFDEEKMQYWFYQLKYPIYHFDFETFPCPLPLFRGENPYRQSVFEFSLHIERHPGICDKQKDNYIFLNEEFGNDEREALAKAIVDNFQFNEDGTLHGTMLAQNTSFEIGRLQELAKLFPKYRDKLLAICDRSADLIHLLKTKKELYLADEERRFNEERAKAVNYYKKNLSGSYSIKKTLPALVPTLTYDGMDVGNGVQAYITYLKYDSTVPTYFDDDTKKAMTTKAERRDALKAYCQQDTWAMVEILRAVREKAGIKEP